MSYRLSFMHALGMPFFFFNAREFFNSNFSM